MEKPKKGLNATDDILSSLFLELYEGTSNDLLESQKNVDAIQTLMDKDNTNGRQIYGEMFNNSLKIKGDARDKQLKLLNMFKERVNTKEKLELVKKDKNESLGPLMDPGDMIKMIEEAEESLKIDEKVVITSEPIDQPVNTQIQKIEDEEDELEEDDFDSEFNAAIEIDEDDE